MQKISSKRFGFSQVNQITPSHCGPAVLQMLLANLSFKTSQEAITKASGAEAKIKTHGTRIDQLALAVSSLFPQVNLFYKRNATLDDLKKIIWKYGYPVGIEWQGIFEEEDEDDDEDEGHYSIIVDIDEEKKEIVMIDPAREFASKERRLPIKIFLPRWWDTNEVVDKKTGKKHFLEDNQLLFIVVPKGEVFPKEIGLEEFS